MNYTPLLESLRAERQEVEALIAHFETLQRLRAGEKPLKRRGRKSMGPTERQEVSARMTRYWANRRKRNATA